MTQGDDAMMLSPQQEKAYANVTAWLRIKFAPFYYLAGYAGTGKSTIAASIAAQADGPVRYAAFTGKAAKVMRQKGCEGATTLHRLIYDAETNEETGKTTFHLTNDRVYNASLIIIDECSMVGEDLAKDLLSFGIPVLVLGDPGQLPPVGGHGFFTSNDPNFMLTEGHRQAADSPILRLATEIREGRFRRVPRTEDGLVVCRKRDLDRSVVPAADMVLVGKNATRAKYNGRLRQIRGFEGESPQKGETVICLRNDKDRAIANGELFTVSKKGRRKKTDAGPAFGMTVADPEDSDRKPVHVSVLAQCFRDPKEMEALNFRLRRQYQEFTYGYCLTVHKSQGSQWDDVVVFDESRAFRQDADRFLYTAITRASRRLTLVI